MSRILNLVPEEHKSFGKYMEIDKNYLLIDHNYQRTKILNPNELSKNWSWPSCGALSVNQREDKFFVYDGQTRLEAAKKLDWITKMPCIVFQLGGRVNEAKEFSRSNKNRKAVTTLEDFKALCAAKDPIAILVQEMLKKSEMKLDENFRAVGHLMEFIVKDKESIERIWPVLVHLCKDQLMTRDILGGCWFLENHMNSGYSLTDAAVIKRLNHIGYEGLRDACMAGKKFFGSGVRKNFALGIQKEINKKRKLISTSI